MESILDSSMFPKNFRVRWIFSGLTHRTSAWADFKSASTSSIFLRIGFGSSIARKDRINQKPLHNPPRPPFIEAGLGTIIAFDVNITVKKVNEKNPSEVLIKRPVLVSGTGPSRLLVRRVNRLFPIAVVGQTFLNIDSVKLLKGHQYFPILLICLLKGVSNNFHPFGRHLSKGWTAWSRR